VKTGRVSDTASIIAVARGLGQHLPDDACLVVDPYGERFGKGVFGFLSRRPFFRPLFQSLVLPIQVRTRLIDLALIEFVEGGGRQILLLGAGFDSRAVRLCGTALTVFEVDHPATQAVKRKRLPESRAQYLPWDFETQPAAGLGAALAALGHDASKPTLTIWEGVTMYLSAEAVDATLSAVRTFSAAGSPLVFTYVERSTLAQHRSRFFTRLVGLRGEPLTLGFEPSEIPAFLEARGLSLRSDASLSSAAPLLLPEAYRGLFFSRGEHVVLSTVGATPASTS
jgi:methyltransferase (TIGR00027 family)